MRIQSLALAAILFFAIACSDSNSSEPVADTTQDDAQVESDVVSVAPDEVFRFGLDPTQFVSAAPFPSDLYLTADGIAMAPLHEDPVLSGVAKTELLEDWDELIVGRDGFSFTTAVRFFMDAAPDLTTFEGHVRFVGLSGYGMGHVFDAIVFWDERTSSLGAFPEWGYAMRPASRYGVVIDAGVKTADGTLIEAPADFLPLLGRDDAPVGHETLHAAWADLRAQVGPDPSGYVMATAFTTESTLPFGRALFASMDEFELTPPTAAVRWDVEAESFIEAEAVEGEALDAYFGVTTDPFSLNPGAWGTGSRADAGTLAELGEPYLGGTMHARIGKVINGSLRVPALHFQADGEGGVVNAPLSRETDGSFTWSLETMVPFTLFLCDTQVFHRGNLPVAVFNHGGSTERMDAIAYANMNCQNHKIATLALDQPFHGGRISVALHPDGDVVVPIREDRINVLSGLTQEDEGFVPDGQGDNGPATATVGQMFGLSYAMNPAILEANHLSIAAETYVAIRYLQEGDWDEILPGLSFDSGNIFHESLSYGSSFTTALLALSDDIRGAISSVGTGYVISANLTMAPSNGPTAAAIIPPAIGTPATNDDLLRAGYEDFGLGLLQWLAQRADPLAWAPFVLRNRQDDHELSVLSSGDSWDETLYTPAQISFNNALGLEVMTADGWEIDSTVKGADNVSSSAWTSPVTGNLTNRDHTYTGVLFYSGESCHSQVVTPVCGNNYQKEPVPPSPLSERTIFDSPICALHDQADAFLGSLLNGADHGEVFAPTSTCETYYDQSLPELPTKAPFSAPADPFAGGEDMSCSIFQAERCEGGELQTCAVYDTGASTFPDDIAPLLRRAYLYDRWRDLYHRADGQLLERVFVGETPAGTPEEEWGSSEHFARYHGGGDSGIWTGWAVTAAVLRYVNTGTEADYQRMEEWVRGLLVKWDVTGIPGYLSRSHYIQVTDGTPGTPTHYIKWGDGPENWMHRPISDPEGVENLPAGYWEGYEDPDGATHQGTAMWAGRPSIDQCSGSMVSLPMAYELLQDEDLKAKIVHHLTCYLHRLQRIELINLQQNKDALDAFMDYFGGGSLAMDPDDMDFSKLDRIVGYVQRQINTINEDDFDTSCPAGIQMEPARVIDAASPSFVLDLLGFIQDMEGHEQERAWGIDHYYFPAIRGGDAMHMMHLATMAYRFTGDEAYREFLYEELIPQIRTTEVAATAGAFDPPNTCKKWFGDQITFGPWWAFLHLLDDCPLRTSMQQSYHTEFWEKLGWDSGNVDFDIMYAGAVAPEIATGRDDALTYALEQLPLMGGNGGVIDDPRRQYSRTAEEVMAQVPDYIEARCPTIDEIDECETEIVFMGVPLPGLTATDPCTGSAWECVIDEDRCAPKEASHVLPVDLRPFTDYLWQRNPFTLGRMTSVEGGRQYPGSDYSVPYWNARQYGFIEEGAGHVLAWKTTGTCD